MPGPSVTRDKRIRKEALYAQGRGPTVFIN